MLNAEIAKSFAERLNGRVHSPRIMSQEEAYEAKQLGVVAVFGYSDDCIEFEGALSDEAYAYDGGTILLSKAGLFEGCECNCEFSRAAKAKCKEIKAVWHDQGGPCWTFETDIPHVTFDIMEDGEVYCKGIVFEIKSLEDPKC